MGLSIQEDFINDNDHNSHEVEITLISVQSTELEGIISKLKSILRERETTVHAVPISIRPQNNAS